jgi:hypothetical protein
MAGANNEFPLFNGFAPSWADCNLKIQPDSVALLSNRDIKSINFGQTVEVGTQYKGGRVNQSTFGQQSVEGSFTLYLSGAQVFERGLKDSAAAQGLTRDGGVHQLSLVFFSFDYNFTPPGAVEIIERRLLGCRLTGKTEAPAEGTDAITRDYTMFVTEAYDMIDGVKCSLL